MSKSKKSQPTIKLMTICYEVFGSARIDYFIESNEKKAHKFMFDLGRAKEFNHNAVGFCWNKSDGWPIVWLKYKRADIVSHEMIHALSWMLDGIGVELKNLDEEILAYLLDYGVKQILK